MLYTNELSFLCEVFRKSHLGTHAVELATLQDDEAKQDFFDPREPIRAILPTVETKTVYRLTDAYARCYRLLLLPGTDAPTVFYVGPFLTSPVSEEHLLNVGEQRGISPQKQRYLLEYYSGLPILSEDCPLLTMFHTLCERIWGGAPFRTLDVTNRTNRTDEPVSRSMQGLETGDDTLVNIKALERRYAFENEMIRAVSLGHTHEESRFRSAFSISFFEKRNTDPLRNAKNYGIIMNTLLRKAAEQGGVHPFQLDQISSELAGRIERLSTVAECATLMVDLFRTYCRAVRKHAIKQYSPIVQRVILTIDADLSANLSPSALARNQGISLGYLSTRFKKETGHTVSAYIHRRRMEYAAYLLENAKLQIQTVALHCGILDVQYFSKLFKRHHQKTPSEYRACAKARHANGF